MNMRLNKMALACVVVAGSALLAACGGGGGSAPVAAVSSTDLSLVASASTAAAIAPAFVSVSSTPIAFPAGFTGTVSKTDLTPALAPAGTTLAFSTGTVATSPVVTVVSGGLTATGTTTFGSCTFTFDANSPFVAPSPFAPGKTLYVDPCSITIPTASITADGGTQSLSVELTLGTTTVSQIVSVVVSATGTVSLNGTPVGTVTVVAPTGTSN